MLTVQTYRSGKLEGQFIKIPKELANTDQDNIENMQTRPNQDEASSEIPSKAPIVFKTVRIKEARIELFNQESDKLIKQFDVQKEAIRAVEETGIVVIDEIDKIVSTGDSRGSDASAEGVQRDLLPIVEGTMVTTKRGNVNTEFILFICAGSFHSVKPSSLLPELQGRLPIRVSLNGLSEAELYRILTEPVNSILKQQVCEMCIAHCTWHSAH